MDEAPDKTLTTINGETLESLIHSSKSPDGRSRLFPILPSLLLRLPPSSSPLLLPHLRLLRNLCAGDLSNQTAFVRSNGPDLIASLLLPPNEPPPEVLKIGLQLLGNVVMAGELQRAAVWARLFPAGFLEMSRVRDAEVCGTLAMVVDTCCSSEGGRGRLEEVCGDEMGLMVVVELITTASQVGYKEEWLEWLLTKLCIEEPNLCKLFSKLGTLGVSNTSNSPNSQNNMFTTEQAFLFRILSKCLSERPHEVTVSHEFAFTVLNVLKEASGFVDFSSKVNSELPTCSPTINVLGYSLVILRDICAWEDSASAITEAPVNSLLSAGILETVLSFLRELEPPLIVKKSIEKANNPGLKPSFPTENLKVCPYKGCRRDLVSVIANCLHKKKQVQDEIRQRNEIPLLLQQCVLDEDNPFLREWGLLAVRNLLEGNLENQREVAELQLQGPVDTPEITGLGLKVEIDEKSGRAKLTNNS